MRSMCLTSVKVVIVKFIECVCIDVQSPAGVWFSPRVSGTRPPPCSTFTLTSIDNHRAVLFGGNQSQKSSGVLSSDLYLINFEFNTMVH